MSYITFTDPNGSSYGAPLANIELGLGKLACSIEAGGNTEIVVAHLNTYNILDKDSAHYTFPVNFHKDISAAHIERIQNTLNVISEELIELEAPRWGYYYDKFGKGFVDTIIANSFVYTYNKFLKKNHKLGVKVFNYPVTIEYFCVQLTMNCMRAYYNQRYNLAL